MIPKANRRSMTATKGERSDKNEYPTGQDGAAPTKRGTHQVRKVNTTAPKSL